MGKKVKIAPHFLYCSSPNSQYPNFVLCFLQKLQHLSLSNNWLGDTCCSLLNTVISSLPSLETLELSSCGFTSNLFQQNRLSLVETVKSKPCFSFSGHCSYPKCMIYFIYSIYHSFFLEKLIIVFKAFKTLVIINIFYTQALVEYI